MGIQNFHIDHGNPMSIREVLDAFDAHGNYYEDAIRTALSIHERPFILLLYSDQIDPSRLSPLHDAFTFNIETDELILYSDDPLLLIDAIIEMAMFQRGFNTIMGTEDEWKVQVAIGAWRHVRESIKTQLQVAPPLEKAWSASLDLETVEHYNLISFGTAVFLASRPDVDVAFPEGTSSTVITIYHRLTRIIETIAFDIGISDHVAFNRRLGRALQWIEETILPTSEEDTTFDDLFGPDNFSDKFLDDGPDELS
jgi:hypothetical protein